MRVSFVEQRRRMVDRQIAARGVRDENVLAAMRLVPREAFVHASEQAYAYDDAPLAIEAGQTISQPFVVALMIEALTLTGSDRVLEVGAGSGYAAAVVSRIAAEVFAVERFPELARLARARVAALGYQNVHVTCRDGSLGWAEHAPYDAILVSAGGPGAPPSLLEQLAEDGSLVIPVGSARNAQTLLRLRRTGPSQFDEESLGQVKFVPLIGREGW